MKKLTKKSLDELAEVMPVISEKNQQECVGGNYFVDATGTFLAQNLMQPDGGISSNSIVVITGYEISGLNTAMSGTQFDSYNGGTYIEWVDNATKIAVYRGFANQAGLDFSGSIRVAESSSYFPAIYLDGNELVFNGNLTTASALSGAIAAYISSAGSGIEP